MNIAAPSEPLNSAEGNPTPTPSLAPFLTTGQKWLFWFGAWALVIASVYAINPDIDLILAPHIFPMGLSGWTFNGHDFVSQFVDQQIFWLKISVAIGWVIYALITIFLIRAKSKLRFFSLYAIFCLLLAFNVLGWHHIIYELNATSITGIH